MMENIFLHLLNMSLTAGLLVVAVVLLRLVFHKAPRWIHCLLWALVAVRLLCPFTLESNLSLMPDTEAAISAVQDAVTETPAPNQSVVTLPESDGSVADTPTANDPVVTPPAILVPPTSGEPTIPESSVSAATPEASVDPWQVVVSVATYVWLAGVALLAVYAVATTLRLRRQVCEAARLTDRVWCCDHLRSPFILGVFRPRIYIPSDLSATAQASVLAHEQAHLHRRDHWWKPLGFVLLTVYWFNPLMWVGYVLLCRDIEAACDERVVRDMTAVDRKAYSEALLACSAPRRLVSACPLAFGETSVKSRIKSVLSYKKPTVWIIVAALVISTVAGVCLLTDPKSDAPDTDKPAVIDETETTATTSGSVTIAGNITTTVGGATDSTVGGNVTASSGNTPPTTGSTTVPTQPTTPTPTQPQAPTAYWQTFSHPMTYEEASRLTGGCALYPDSVETLQKILDEVTWGYGMFDDMEYRSSAFFSLDGETRYFWYGNFLYKENAPLNRACADLTEEQSDILADFARGGIMVKGTHTLRGYFAEWNKQAQFYELDVVQADDASLIGKRIWVSTRYLLGRGIPYIGSLLEVSYDGTVHSNYQQMVYAIEYDVLHADEVKNVTIPDSDTVKGKVIHVVDGAALMYFDDLEPYDTVLWVNYEFAYPDLKPQIGEMYQVAYDGLIKTTYPVQLVAKTMTKMKVPPISSDFISEERAIELAAEYWNIQPGSIDSETAYAAVIYVMVAPTEKVQQYVMGLRYVDALHGGPANSAIFYGIHIDAVTGKIWDMPID